jgi:hypothetical protein
VGVSLADLTAVIIGHFCVLADRNIGFLNLDKGDSRRRRPVSFYNKLLSDPHTVAQRDTDKRRINIVYHNLIKNLFLHTITPIVTRMFFLFYHGLKSE